MFMTKRGRLTAYSFLCGYIEQWFINSIRIEIYMEHRCYHIRAFNLHRQRLAWESTDTVSKARKMAEELKRKARNNQF